MRLKLKVYWSFRLMKHCPIFKANVGVRLKLEFGLIQRFCSKGNQKTAWWSYGTNFLKLKQQLKQLNSGMW